MEHRDFGGGGIGALRHKKSWSVTSGQESTFGPITVLWHSPVLVIATLSNILIPSFT
jgi:hypothetical protein